MKLILDNPTFAITQQDKTFKLVFSENENDFEIELSEHNAKALGLELIRVCPVIKPEIKLEGSNDSYRMLAAEMKNLDDRSMQLWLREVQSDALISFLWFMKDKELLDLVFRNMSARAAEMLLDDLTEVALRRGDPDGPRVNKKILIESRDVLKGLMDIFARLEDEGQI